LRQVKASVSALGERSGQPEGYDMPYPSNAELPIPVRRHLPPSAQDIYREAFNHAWNTYAWHQRREEIAHRVAWTAVKHAFHKGDDGYWEPNR
jgi:cation transport regulator